MNEYRDAFGKDIKVGDYIVYAGTAGRSSVFHFGKVVELSRRTTTALDVPPPTVKIIGAEHFYGKYMRHEQVDTLGFFDRLLVVPADTLPISLHQLLNASKDELCQHRWVAHHISEDCEYRKD